MIKSIKPALSVRGASLAAVSSAQSLPKSSSSRSRATASALRCQRPVLLRRFIDYLTYVNLKGGVNGVTLTHEECETEYNNAKGVECYERLKGKAAKSAGPIHTMSTGISYALIDKSAADKLPLAMMGYGRTDAVDGSVFPYAFRWSPPTRCRPRPSSSSSRTRTAATWPARRSFICTTTPPTARKPSSPWKPRPR